MRLHVSTVLVVLNETMIRGALFADRLRRYAAIRQTTTSIGANVYYCSNLQDLLRHLVHDFDEAGLHMQRRMTRRTWNATIRISPLAVTAKEAAYNTVQASQQFQITEYRVRATGASADT